MGEIGAFLGIAVLVIATPGQDTALVIRNTLRGGRRDGALTALGIVTGQAIWVIAVSLGIATLLLAAEPIFVAIKLSGAAYLVWLGAHALRDAFRASDLGNGTIRHTSPRLLSGKALLRQGMLSSLGNPKLAIFFTSFLPQFAPDGTGARITLLALGGVFGLLTLGWLAVYVIALARAGDVLLRPRVRRAFDGITGIVLVAFGVRLAVQQR